MFESEAQAHRAISWWFACHDCEGFWNLDGPTEDARDALKSDGRGFSPNVRAMILCAWAMYNGNDRIRLSELLRDLHRNVRVTLFSLLRAQAEGTEAVERLFPPV